MIDDIKDALRVSGDDHDTEIGDIIASACADLVMSGVLDEKVFPDEDLDPLIKRAIILYAKASFGYDDDSEKFAKSYQSLKNHLVLSEGYGK